MVGSFGVQIIKDEGGQVIAQDRPTSQDFSMPETAIKTGDVDFTLPLNEIASKLIELVDARRGKRIAGRLGGSSGRLIPICKNAVLTVRARPDHPSTSLAWMTR